MAWEVNCNRELERHEDGLGCALHHDRFLGLETTPEHTAKLSGGAGFHDSEWIAWRARVQALRRRQSNGSCLRVCVRGTRLEEPLRLKVRDKRARNDQQKGYNVPTNGCFSHDA